MSRRKPESCVRSTQASLPFLNWKSTSSGTSWKHLFMSWPLGVGASLVDAAPDRAACVDLEEHWHPASVAETPRRSVTIEMILRAGTTRLPLGRIVVTALPRLAHRALPLPSS